LCFFGSAAGEDFVEGAEAGHFGELGGDVGLVGGGHACGLVAESVGSAGEEGKGGFKGICPDGVVKGDVILGVKEIDEGDGPAVGWA
jgi:hypothetical protein